MTFVPAGRDPVGRDPAGVIQPSRWVCWKALIGVHLSLMPAGRILVLFCFRAWAVSSSRRHVQSDFRAWAVRAGRTVFRPCAIPELLQPSRQEIISRSNVSIATPILCKIRALGIPIEWIDDSEIGKLDRSGDIGLVIQCEAESWRPKFKPIV